MKKLICLLLMLFVIILPSGCASTKKEDVSNDTNSIDADVKDEIIMAIDREPASFDPGDVSVSVKRMIESNIYDSLLDRDVTMKIIPGLAESWEQLDDLTWKFNLRKGVKFHNGEELKSSDVVFSIKRLFHSVAGQANIVHIDPDGFETPDNYTVIIRTVNPYAFVEALMAGPETSILCEKAVNKAGKDVHGRNPVGTGPYKFVSWLANDRITLEKNEDYWGKTANINKVVIRIITESASRTIDLEAGGIDMTLSLPHVDVERVDSNTDLQLLTHTTSTIRYLGFNMQQEKLSNPIVRRALNYATEAKAIQEVVYGHKTSVLAETPVAPGFSGRNEDLVQYDYNIDKAKSLLKEAGYDDSNPFEIEIMYLANSGNNMLVGMLQEMWSKANVSLILKPTESATLSTSLNNGEHELCSAGSKFALGEAGDGLYRMFASKTVGTGSNRTNLSNPEVDKLLDRIVTTPDANERAQLVYQVQEKIHELSPMIYLANTKAVIGASKHIKGLELIPNTYYDFSKLYLEQ